MQKMREIRDKWSWEQFISIPHCLTKSQVSLNKVPQTFKQKGFKRLLLNF